MREPEQGELFSDDFVHDVYLIETDAEALASAGFHANEESYNEQNWDDIVYGN